MATTQAPPLTDWQASRSCPVCGESFIPSTRRQKTCSSVCGGRLPRRNRPQLTDRIASTLAASSLTQQDVARIIGCVQSGVSQRLHGKTAWRLNELELLAEALDVPVSELLADTIGTAGSSPRQREGSTPFNRQDGRKQKGTGRTLGPRPNSKPRKP